MGDNSCIEVYRQPIKVFKYSKIARKSRIKIPNRVSIHEREEKINERSEIGYWEADLMLFGKKTKVNLITLREHSSRYMVAIKKPNREATTIAQKIINSLEKSKLCVKSLTFDN